MILLQTLVISVLLSMMAVMVLKWVLGRYMFAARNYRSTVAKVHAQGYAMRTFSEWNFMDLPILSNGSVTPDAGGKMVTYSAAYGFLPTNGATFPNSNRAITVNLSTEED